MKSKYKLLFRPPYEIVDNNPLMRYRHVWGPIYSVEEIRQGFWRDGMYLVVGYMRDCSGKHYARVIRKKGGIKLDFYLAHPEDLRQISFEQAMGYMMSGKWPDDAKPRVGEFMCTAIGHECFEGHGPYMRVDVTCPMLQANLTCAHGNGCEFAKEITERDMIEYPDLFRETEDDDEEEG